MPRPAGDLLRASLGLLRQSVHACNGFLPEGEGRGLLRELGNKLEVCERFQCAPADAARRGGAAAPASPAAIAELTAGASYLPPYERLWVIEGLGHAWTAAACSAGEPCGLLAGLPAAAVPATSWLPLHTGMGLALAAHVLRTMPPAWGDRAAANGPRGEPAAETAVRRFLRLCAGNARPELATATFEALGFAAHNLAAATLPALAAAVGRHAPERWTAFWHGAGRGLYLSPLAMVPGGTGWALARAAAPTPHPLGCQSAVAGVGWAMALVNLRHPDVLAALLARHLSQPGLAAHRRALADGLAAALRAAVAMGLAPLLQALRRPCPPLDAARWRRLVAAPCERALDAAGTGAADEPGAAALDRLFLYPATSSARGPSW